MTRALLIGFLGGLVLAATRAPSDDRAAAARSAASERSTVTSRPNHTLGTRCTVADGCPDCVPTITCGTLGYVCGPYTNDCGTAGSCGTCAGAEDGGTACWSGECVCVGESDAVLCASLGYDCGNIGIVCDRCSNCHIVSDCGSCTGEQTCVDNVCT